MQKIILFYIFRPIKDPEAIKLWQKALCLNLNLKGRIIISRHGINGTLGGLVDDLKTYIKTNKEYESFKEIKYKWSEGGREDFPRTSIKVRDELVSFKIGDELEVNDYGVVDGGKKLKPEMVHQLIQKYPKDVVFFDGRNQYEAKIGRFKNAVYLKTRTSKDFANELQSKKWNNLKKKKIITYCTGGIRCEILTKMMKNRGFKEVYQIDGGIAKYIEKYKDQGLWEGSLFVFDQRLSLKVGSNKDIGECLFCKQSTSQYLNCKLKSCNDLVLICQNCAQNPDNLYHTKQCEIEDKKLQSA